jgi:ABC-type hemin transport system ATPase subunit
MDDVLRAEFDYFIMHQDELVAQYAGKFIVLKDGKVLGAYDTALAAVLETQKTHQIGTFLVQMAVPGKEAFTQTFHSRFAVPA